MEELGATIVTVEMSNFDELLEGSGLIGHEFKWDLIDYLATVPDAPVASLGEIIELGLLHDALLGGMLRRNETPTRDSDEYRDALAARGTLRSAVLAEMNRLSLDALAYPTIRRVASRVGEPQRGSSCQLSASTGMPALALPAGWSDGLPVGFELLGRPFADARLVALGYAFEQANDPRRAPALTPPLPRGDALVAGATEIRLSSAAADATVRRRA
jgi:Asp-tRNA(Asn)/Glu-tRNA(Gln) amidotransferase A subunit family amidase